MMYELEREDRTVTEKLRYFEDLENFVEVRRQRNTTGNIVDKEETESAMKHLIQEININLEKRNRVEN